MEIIVERLRREFEIIDLISTAPSVQYLVRVEESSEEMVIDNPAEFPERKKIYTRAIY